MYDSAKVHFAKAKIAEIEAGFSDVANELNRIYADKAAAIKEWARHLETLIDAGELEIPKTAVSWHIKKRLAELGVNITDRYVEMNVPESCKRAYTKPVKKEESVESLTEKPIELLTNGERYEMAQKLEDQGREMSFRAREIYKALEKDNYVPPEERDNPKISVRKFTRSVESADSIRGVARQLNDIADKVEDFAPSEEFDAIMKKEFDLLGKLLNPFKDDRWTKDPIQWFNTQKDAAEYSKSYAAKKNATRWKDEDGKEQVRELTPEQVTNKEAETLEMAAEVLSSAGWLSTLHKWHVEFREKFLGERKLKLSPNLQAKA